MDLAKRRIAVCRYIHRYINSVILPSIRIRRSKSFYSDRLQASTRSLQSQIMDLSSAKVSQNYRPTTPPQSMIPRSSTWFWTQRLLYPHSPSNFVPTANPNQHFIYTVQPTQLFIILQSHSSSVSWSGLPLLQLDQHHPTQQALISSSYSPTYTPTHHTCFPILNTS